MKAFIHKNQSKKLWERCRSISNLLKFNSVYECVESRKMTAVQMTHDCSAFTILELSFDEFVDCTCINIDCQVSGVHDAMLSDNPRLETQFMDLLFKEIEPAPNENALKLKAEDYLHY